MIEIQKEWNLLEYLEVFDWKWEFTQKELEALDALNNASPEDVNSQISWYIKEPTKRKWFDLEIWKSLSKETNPENSELYKKYKNILTSVWVKDIPSVDTLIDIYKREWARLEKISNLERQNWKFYKYVEREIDDHKTAYNVFLNKEEEGNFQRLTLTFVEEIEEPSSLGWRLFWALTNSKASIYKIHWVPDNQNIIDAVISWWFTNTTDHPIQWIKDTWINTDPSQLKQNTYRYLIENAKSLWYWFALHKHNQYVKDSKDPLDDWIDWRWVNIGDIDNEQLKTWVKDIKLPYEWKLLDDYTNSKNVNHKDWEDYYIYFENDKWIKVWLVLSSDMTSLRCDKEWYNISRFVGWKIKIFEITQQKNDSDVVNIDGDYSFDFGDSHIIEGWENTTWWVAIKDWKDATWWVESQVTIDWLPQNPSRFEWNVISAINLRNSEGKKIWVAYPWQKISVEWSYQEKEINWKKYRTLKLKWEDKYIAIDLKWVKPWKELKIEFSKLDIDARLSSLDSKVDALGETI